MGGIGSLAIRPLPQGYMSSSLIALDAGGRVVVCLEKPSPEERAMYAGKNVT